jgi:hypothetical protein
MVSDRWAPYDMVVNFHLGGDGVGRTLSVGDAFANGFANKRCGSGWTSRPELGWVQAQAGVGGCLGRTAVDGSAATLNLAKGDPAVVWPSFGAHQSDQMPW